MTQDNADAKLLPCGNCGAPARWVPKAWRVKCTRPSCGIEGGKFERQIEATAAWNARPQSADAGVESAVKSVQRRLAELTGDRRIDDELRFELNTAIRYIREDARHPSPADASGVGEEELARRIVAENIDAWGWGPLSEIDGLTEHTLAVNAVIAGLRTHPDAEALAEALREGEIYRRALERIADPRNIHFAGDAQVVAAKALRAAKDTVK